MIVAVPHPLPELLPLLLLADPSQAQIEGYLPEADAFAAYHEATAIGCVVLKAEGSDWGEIKNLAVAPAWQGRGLGAALLRFAEAEAARRGWRRLRICTGNSSRGPLHLYQKLGFQLIATDHDYFLRHYPEPIWEGECWCRDRLVLEKRIAG